MKRALTSATVMTAILITATFVWAGGMGGSMRGGPILKTHGSMKTGNKAKCAVIREDSKWRSK
jgi:hypothetical protein